jgi:hypothetical protein
VKQQIVDMAMNTSGIRDTFHAHSDPCIRKTTTQG